MCFLELQCNFGCSGHCALWMLWVRTDTWSDWSCPRKKRADSEKPLPNPHEEDPRSNPKLQHVRDEIERKTGWRKIKKTIDELITICGTNYHKELNGEKPLPVFLNRMFLGNPGTGKTTCAKLYGELLKNLGFLNSGDVVFKTAGDLGGSVVGEAQQKVLGVLQSAAGKVLVIDEAYNLNDGLYGKQAGSADDVMM